MVTIRLRKNGPYVIDDETVKVVDWEGRECHVTRWPVALCRCGASAKKPFCDRSHAELGFKDVERPMPARRPDPTGEGVGRSS